MSIYIWMLSSMLSVKCSSPPLPITTLYTPLRNFKHVTSWTNAVIQHAARRADSFHTRYGLHYSSDDQAPDQICRTQKQHSHFTKQSSLLGQTTVDANLGHRIHIRPILYPKWHCTHGKLPLLWFHTWFFYGELISDSIHCLSKYKVQMCVLNFRLFYPCASDMIT